MINVAVCDDNEHVVSYLEKCIGNSFRTCTHDFCLKTFTDGNELLKAHSKEAFQVLFLDIDMPDITGFDVARVLRDDFSKCYIVFITSHSDLVYKSLDFQPFNFIRKNPSELLAKSIKSVVMKLMANMKQSESVVLETGDGEIVVYYRDILYVKSDRHYLYYYLKNHDDPIKLRGKMGEIEEGLEKHSFIRIHRRFIVNMKYILNIDNSIGKVDLKLESRQSIPMSRSYEKTANEIYTLYLRESL